MSAFCNRVEIFTRIKISRFAARKCKCFFKVKHPRVQRFVLVVFNDSG